MLHRALVDAAKLLVGTFGCDDRAAANPAAGPGIPLQMPAVIAARMCSARSQSSGVSMSCTRQRGNIKGAVSAEKIGLPASQACGRPQ